MSLTGDVSKVRKCSITEIGLLAEAYLLLGVMRFLILMLPFQRIVSLFRLQAGSSMAWDDTEAATEKQSLIAWAIAASASRTPWESACLGQALTGMFMLRRRKLHGTIYLGVSIDTMAVEGIAAHAWLKSGDRITIGMSGHERFSVISSYSW